MSEEMLNDWPALFNQPFYQNKSNQLYLNNQLVDFPGNYTSTAVASNAISAQSQAQAFATHRSIKSKQQNRREQEDNQENEENTLNSCPICLESLTEVNILKINRNLKNNQ